MKAQTSRIRQRGLHRFLVLLVVLAVFTLVLETSSLLGILEGRQLIPRPSIDVNEVSEEDLLHLNLLHEHCVLDAIGSLPWKFGSPGHQLPNASAANPEVVMYQDDPSLLQKLRQCPDVDIFLPTGLHGNGYCEDAVAYAKYLNSRLLPKWALEIKLFDPDLGHEVDYFDLCPQTPMIFFNHYWDDVPSMPRWPKDKPIYLMPNIEMFELTAAYYWKVDVVLCKTQECYNRVTKWYEQEGNPRNASVFYTKHTSSDQAQFARKRLGDDFIAPKNFSDVKFVHTPGSSAWKGTRELMQCWVLHPDMPPLDVYIDPKTFNRLFKPSFKNLLNRSRSPVNVHLGLIDRSSFTKLTAETSFFMCPSTSEGYGHYINQARASGAVVITTDLSPMNELITSNATGLLIPVTSKKHPGSMLGGAYTGKHGLKGVEGLYASFKESDVCEVVRHLMNSTTTEDRATMAANARRAYLEDTKYFADAMQKLREFAKGDQ